MDTLEAAEVLRILDIKPQTLYAYVSRGLLRRTTAPGSKRSLYAREDVEALLSRKTKRDGYSHALEHGMGAAMAATIPTLTSSLTEITPEALRYRGRDVRSLAVHPGCLENVAELLWTGVLPDGPVAWEYDEIPGNLEAAIASLQRGDGHVPMTRIMANVSLVLGESASNELRSGSTTRLARRLVMSYAGSLGHARSAGKFIHPRPGESVANMVLRATGSKVTKESSAAVNATLIWCADHELSSPAYVARVIASTGSGLHGCLSGAMAAHSGSLAGGGCDRLEELLAQRPTAARLREMFAGVRKGVRLPGFGHVLYPNGDPRAPPLLDIAMQLAAPKLLSDMQTMMTIAREEADLAPTLEFGLVAVSRALGLPPRTASSLWAVGRSVGWIGHVIEQRLSGGIIRPRARRASM